MVRCLFPQLLLSTVLLLTSATHFADAQEARIEGTKEPWHKLTLSFTGPECSETDTEPNPFRDYRFSVTFRHADSDATFKVPGFFAADGRAAETSADRGNVWRAHFAAPHAGRWTWEVEFVQGRLAAIQTGEKTEPVAPLHGQKGEFTLSESSSEKGSPYARGRLIHNQLRYLTYAETGAPFLKFGPDAPETLLGYSDFDGTVSRSKKGPLKNWEPHRRDWNAGDPTWKSDRGKGLIGALNYLSDAGCNAFSFLTYNAGGDGDNVWPFVARDQPLHFDCSKLDQWGIVFDHAQSRGLFLHFKLQETENDDVFAGHNRNTKDVPTALDGGDTGIERKLYLRELVSRFGYLLAMEWNLGEENTQTFAQQKAMAQYLAEIDPYDHLIVLHTFPNEQEQVYEPFLNEETPLGGLSLQNSWSAVHERTQTWLRRSREAGKHWVICNDEQNPAGLGVPPDPGYQGHSGVAVEKNVSYDLHDIRRKTLWGNLMAGGGGVMYYFGYKLPENDLVCQDFRSRARSWDFGRIALKIFDSLPVPVHELTPADERIQGSKDSYCLAKDGSLYVLYLSKGGSIQVDLSREQATFDVVWHNPRTGGEPIQSSRSVKGGGTVSIGPPPAELEEDWVAVLKKR
ncbi:DUF5060 domain-containing protein [Rubinisphaera margarita]|uniref:DUF5060 domain-containing protein n=1 Tax=Rubinisphaera margarita TaxID=2909586 RepID=UPI001EE8B12B|nr:DUF5060 domain-containing protein [Rubinisphaera margarita]MCG6154415.1 DUF5060 domain-containing protein [Rubinisphaera margarita]